MPATISRLYPSISVRRGAEEAANFYVSIFPDSGVGPISRYMAGAVDIHGQEPGTAMVVEFKLNGQPFTILNVPNDNMVNSERVSLTIEVDTQDEVDYYWEKLCEGGDPAKRFCGWVLDKYGVWWQVVPKIVPETMVNGTEEEKITCMKTVMVMGKIVVKEVEDALEGLKK